MRNFFSLMIYPMVVLALPVPILAQESRPGLSAADLFPKAGLQVGWWRTRPLPVDGRLLPALRLCRRLLPQSLPTTMLAAVPAILPVRSGRRLRTSIVCRRRK
jgi:hypothetical protein